MRRGKCVERKDDVLELHRQSSNDAANLWGPVEDVEVDAGSAIGEQLLALRDALGGPDFGRFFVVIDRGFEIGQQVRREDGAA